MSTQPNLFSKSYDVSYRKHGGNEQSVSANPTDESKANRRTKILEYIASRKGTTLLDVAKKFGWEKNAVSGRLTELRQAGLIVKDGNDGKFAIYYATEPK